MATRSIASASRGTGAASARVQTAFRRAFDVPRDPTSIEYRRGVVDALAYRLDGRRIVAPYAPGSCAYDAWHAGLEEGHRRGCQEIAASLPV